MSRSRRFFGSSAWCCLCCAAEQKQQGDDEEEARPWRHNSTPGAEQSQATGSSGKGAERRTNFLFSIDPNTARHRPPDWPLASSAARARLHLDATELQSSWPVSVCMFVCLSVCPLSPESMAAHSWAQLASFLASTWPTGWLINESTTQALASSVGQLEELQLLQLVSCSSSSFTFSAHEPFTTIQMLYGDKF